MQARWLTPILLMSISCSDGRTGEQERPTENIFANSADEPGLNRSLPSAQAIIAAGDCEPPPCDDVGACARMPIAEVRDLQCLVGPSGETARCSFEMVPGIRSKQEQLRQTRRVTFHLRRHNGDTWCIGT